MTDMNALSAQVFSYAAPDLGEKRKKIVRLCRTDRMAAQVQVVGEGGENNLHSHDHQDGFRFVLKGRVRFYGEGDVVLGEFGPLQGILIPRTFDYWFESCSDDPLELLQLEAFDRPFGSEQEIIEDRVNHEALRASVNPATVEVLDAES